MWSLLAATLEKFYQAWEEGTPPEISKFLPDSPNTLRKFALIELIKVDMELRLENRQPRKSLGDFAREFPDLLTHGRIEPELIFEEIDLCKRFQVDLDSQQYLEDFPAQADFIKKLFGAKDTEPGIRPRRRTSSGLSAGESVDDFELLIEIGKGAFATVFLARQKSMQRLVALKVSSEQGDEPKTLAQLDCKNIVRVFDVRDITDPPCRLLYMKFVAGGTLHDVVSRVKGIPPSQRTGGLFLSIVDERVEKTGQDIPLDSRTRQRILAMEWFELVFWLGAEISAGLNYAHQRKVLHRDLKPANILLTPEGIPQIVDFNVSYCSEVEGASAETFFGGSLAYMSPEQLQAFDPKHPCQPGDLDQASDLFSLGVILWELLFESRPYEDSVRDDGYLGVLEELVKQRENFPFAEKLPAEASQWNIDVGPLFKKLLEPEPKKRLKSAKVLAGELNLLSDRESRELLRPVSTRLFRFANQALIPFVILAVVLPSLVAAVFNFFYNFKSIIEPKGEDVAATFQTVQLVINAIAFPIGIALLSYFGWRLLEKFRSAKEGALPDLEKPSKQPVRRVGNLRSHIVRMPLIAVLVPISIWTLAGAAYPVAMNLAGSELTMSDSLHFITSLILCGMIASVYPFFLVAYTSIRFWYPRAFHTHEINSRDLVNIEKLTQRVWFFMGLAILLPTFSILLMVTTQKENDRVLLAVLAGFSFIALGAVFILFQKLQKHLETVRRAIQRIIESDSAG